MFVSVVEVANVGSAGVVDYGTVRTPRVALYLVQEGMPHNQRPKLVGESIKRTFHFVVYVHAMFFGNSSATSTFTAHKIDMCQDRTGTRTHIQSAEEITARHRLARRI